MILGLQQVQDRKFSARISKREFSVSEKCHPAPSMWGLRTSSLMRFVSGRGCVGGFGVWECGPGSVGVWVWVPECVG